MDDRIVWLITEYGPWALGLLVLASAALVFAWRLAGMRARQRE